MGNVISGAVKINISSAGISRFVSFLLGNLLENTCMG